MRHMHYNACNDDNQFQDLFQIYTRYKTDMDGEKRVRNQKYAMSSKPNSLLPYRTVVNTLVHRIVIKVANVAAIS